MPQIPPRAVKLHLPLYVSIRRHGAKRIIDPQTGFQYEVPHTDALYHCAICGLEQAAPAADGVDYACPRCKWRYKTYDEMLVVWHPATQGVETPALSPGETPFIEKLVEGASDNDPERAEAEYQKSTKRWRQGDPSWGKRIQTLTPAGEGSGSPDSSSRDNQDSGEPSKD